MEREDLVTLLKDSIAQFQAVLESLSVTDNAVDPNVDEEKAAKIVKRVYESCERNQKNLVEFKNSLQGRFKKLRKQRKRKNNQSEDEQDTDEAAEDESGVETDAQAVVESNGVTNIPESTDDETMFDAQKTSTPEEINGISDYTINTNDEKDSDQDTIVEPTNNQIKLRPIEQLLEATSNASKSSDNTNSTFRVPSRRLTAASIPIPASYEESPKTNRKRVPAIVLKRLPDDLKPMLKNRGLCVTKYTQSIETERRVVKDEPSGNSTPKVRKTKTKVPEPSTSKDDKDSSSDDAFELSENKRQKTDKKLSKVDAKETEKENEHTPSSKMKTNASATMRQSRKRVAPKKAVISFDTDDSDNDEAPTAASSNQDVEDEISNDDTTSKNVSKSRKKKPEDDDFELDKDEEASEKNDESDSDTAAVDKSKDDDDSDFVISKKRKARKKSTNSDNSDSSDVGKKKKRRRIKNESENNDSSDGDGSPSKGRKNIRKVIKSKDLEDETKRAAREENERKKRIEDRQKKYNEYYDDKPEEVKELDKLILDFDEQTKEELISVDSALVRKLKPHQGQGVKFMWDTCFESIEQIDKGPGSGCILAHCMGLGKSLQVVTLVHTLLAHSSDTKVEKVLVICPLSTVLNWMNEFKMWLKQCKANKKIELYEISKFKQNYERVYQINEWHQEGGVLILGYEMFRNLSSETSRLKKREKQTIQTALVDPGPDLVVCDEGHLLKNSKTSLSKAVNRLKTLRRIVLTGTPLQNNLNEYYCMVQFVKPNLLGKYNEYLNRFVNPITNGQYVDSTPRDITMMKRRSHILHKLLDGSVQRRDYAVLAPYLPIKHEYVVYIQLSKLQIELYKYYMEHKPVTDQSKPNRTSMLFQDFQNLQRIWTHPRVLRYNSDRFEIKAQKKRDEMSDEESEGSLKDFIDNSSESEESTAVETSDDSDDDSDAGTKKKKSKASSSRGAIASSSRSSGPATRRTRANKASATPEPEVIPEKIENPTEWWMSMCPEAELDILKHSGKLMLLFSLLEECEQIGDKLLVFSQSLYSLDVIEHFLSKIDECTQRLKKKNAIDDDDDEDEERANLGGYSGSWSMGLDYFRLDGSTNIENRNIACKHFNRDDTPRARLFLISTRAGGLGINLVSANRVVIFDVSWNPSHDIQSIFRVYRFGQKKPCYIYRLIAMGTMEEKIYERQVTKLAISKRVIDEHQIDRHYKENDLMELYKTELEPVEPRPIPILPKDRLFASQLKRFEETIFKYHEHDSLLENKSEETLNEDEIKAAWEEFEAEKVVKPPVNYMPQQRMHGSGPVTSNHIFGIRSDILLQLLRMQAIKTYPQADENQVKQLVPLLLQQLYERMQTGDTSMLQQLMVLQSELESPSMSFNQMINPMGAPGPVMNPYGPINPQFMQQQQLIAQAQNRLLGKPQMQMHQPGQSRPPPTQSNTVIELD